MKRNMTVHVYRLARDQNHKQILSNISTSSSYKHGQENSGRRKGRTVEAGGQRGYEKGGMAKNKNIQNDEQAMKTSV